MNRHRGADFTVYGKADAVLKRRPVAVTFGNFDGVHKGHQKLLSDLREIAGGNPTVAITFDPHPSRFFNLKDAKPMLNSLEERVKLLLENGADIVYVQDFNSVFSALSADDFCRDFLPSRFFVYAALLGFNFCYGKKRVGCWTHFKPIADQFGWVSKQAAPFSVFNVEVSSSKVREALAAGDVALAEKLMGRAYFIQGQVVEGDKKGRTLGFPTANLNCRNEILPQNGVYAVKVKLPGEAHLRLGALNCGFRPTMGAGLKLQTEVHILDFDQDIYGHNLEVFLYEKIRSERRFDSLENLKTQIATDVASVRRFFEKSHSQEGRS